MNKERRKQIEEIAGQIGALKDRLEELRDTEQESFDNMPEGLQQVEQTQRVMRVCRKRNDNPTLQPKQAPHWHRFTNGRF